MEELNQILAAATRGIGDRYFWLPIDGGDPIYRERVYCYELYHQMRIRWPPDSPFTLNGEVDKRAHPILRRLDAANTIPDFLVHVPGNMEGNHAIIEVKSNGPSLPAIRSDIQKLNRFQDAVGYNRGLYLVYGDDADADIERVAQEAERFNLQDTFELWIHSDVGAEAQRAF